MGAMVGVEHIDMLAKLVGRDFDLTTQALDNKVHGNEPKHDRKQRERSGATLAAFWRKMQGEGSEGMGRRNNGGA